MADNGRTALRVLALSTTLLSGLGCPPVARGPAEIGEARLDLEIVPADVRCLQLLAEGSRTVERAFDVSPGGPTALHVDGLPLGLVGFRARAFPAGCGAAAG